VGAVAVTSGVFVLRGRKSVYELGYDALVECQQLARLKIEDRLGAGSYPRCCTAMLAEYEGFAARLPAFEDRNNRGVFYRNAPFVLSLYRALRGEFGLSQDEALPALREITNHKVRAYLESEPVNRFIMARVAKNDFYRKLFLSVWKRQDEPYGWTTEFPDSDAYIAIDVTRCGLVDWYAEQGAPEVAPIGCEGDFIVAEYMPGLELARSQTIADGDQACVFRYVKAHPGS
jgi:hypothetical protein